MKTVTLVYLFRVPFGESRDAGALIEHPARSLPLLARLHPREMA